VVPPLEVHSVPELQIAYAVCRGVEVKEVRADVVLEVLKLVEKTLSSLDEELLRRDKILSLYRSFIERRLGGVVDIRIYPELLLRRVLSGRPFPQNNSVVDLVNAVSLVTRLAMSVLDLHKLTPPLRMVYLDKETSVWDAKGKVVRLRKGSLVLVDSQGRVLYIYPYKVTGEACVDLNTRDVVVLSYGAPGIPKTTLVDGVAKVVEHLLNYDHSISCTSVWTSP
jgi:DNA/RNA-binding domain of Phe-tRNA-synthetase-like protein